jgi:MFS transporter, FSR family, fosmidomycin resistance protein
MAALSVSHTVTDMCQGSVPALLPFLIHDRGYSYAAASAFVLAATVSSSVVQPLFGHFADRRSLSWLMPVGLLLGTGGVALIGLTSAYWLTFVTIVVSGFGVAAFHPEASRFANYVSGDRRASGMSLFSLGGNIGFALGPVIVTPAVLAFGLKGTLVMLIPGVIASLMVASQLGYLHRFRPAIIGRRGGDGAAPDDWVSFTKLCGVIFARTLVFFGLITFLPLYFVKVLGETAGAGNTALAAFLFGGAAGTALGGPLADRFGRRTVVMTSLATLPPLILIFHVASPGLATVLGFVVGMATVSTFAVTIVMGQEYLPGRIGMASGATMGLSIGLGGVSAPLLGLIADRWGLDVTLDVVTAMPLLGLALAFTLPRGSRVRDQREAATATA